MFSKTPKENPKLYDLIYMYCHGAMCYELFLPLRAKLYIYAQVLFYANSEILISFLQHLNTYCWHTAADIAHFLEALLLMGRQQYLSMAKMIKPLLLQMKLFNEAAQISPDDVDVHIVLGVLYNLSREYDKAIGSFQTILKLKPRDYSLWNKLDATQANSVQSAEAISAYQQIVIWNNCNLE
ncbi:hypothetical protein GIB67_016334 [Kingdonia uniflora]|uniref:Tetratricopeptide repeat protein n=1 Tax=Kingdonia uniflora TaxID=39325 RepID=A0A7J7M9K0_9MAGN|nr:hypothetical protein GIB67_016334 [Kingdonia uniflora]